MKGFDYTGELSLACNFNPRLYFRFFPNEQKKTGTTKKSKRRPTQSRGTDQHISQDRTEFHQLEKTQIVLTTGIDGKYLFPERPVVTTYSDLSDLHQ